MRGRGRAAGWWLAALGVVAGAGAGDAGAGAARAPTPLEVRGWDWVAGQPWANAAVDLLADANAQVEAAYRLEKDKRWSGAAAQYYFAVKVWPAAPQAPLALQRLALCLFALSDHHRAFRAIDQLFDSYPAFAEPYGQAVNLLSIELKIANRLADRAAEPDAGARRTVAGVYIPTPAECRGQAENVFDTMILRLDALLGRATRAGDDEARETLLALARAVAKGKARLRRPAMA